MQDNNIYYIIGKTSTHDGNVHQIQLLQNDPQRLDRALQNARVRHVELVPPLPEQSSALAGLGQSPLVEARVRPAGEDVEIVPRRFAVPDEHELVRAEPRRRGIRRRRRRRRRRRGGGGQRPRVMMPAAGGGDDDDGGDGRDEAGGGAGVADDGRQDDE